MVNPEGKSVGGRAGVIIPAPPEELFAESPSKNEFSENSVPEQPFYLLFQTPEEKTPVYFSAKRYLTKTEVRKIEELYGIQFRGYVIPAERMLEFALCRQFEEAVERFVSDNT
ncbi:hypothetical protein [Desulfurobacterium sp.]